MDKPTYKELIETISQLCHNFLREDEFSPMDSSINPAGEEALLILDRLKLVNELQDSIYEFKDLDFNLDYFEKS